MLNRVILQGNIGRTPELKLTQQGKEMLTFYLATAEVWKDEKGEWQTSTDWHHIVVFRASTVNALKDVLKRGDRVYLEGKLSYHSWTDKYNQHRFMSHVVIESARDQIHHLGPSRASLKAQNPESEASLLMEEDAFDGPPQSFPLEEDLI